MDAQNKSAGPSRWPGYVAIGVAVVAAGVVWAAKSTHSAANDARELAQDMAAMQGHPTCKLATLKAARAMQLGGRSMEIFAPDVLTGGAEPVVACAMKDLQGAKAEPVTVRVLCPRADLDCVELIRR